MDTVIFSNVSVYKSIAVGAYTKMVETSISQRTAKPDGSGFILRYDPDQISFKNALVSIVFTGMWLEALTHLHIVQKFGDSKFNEYDRKSYEEKLKLLGVSDVNLLSLVEKFRKTRKELVHEKACFDDGIIKKAQQEAELAHEVMSKIEQLLR